MPPELVSVRLLPSQKVRFVFGEILAVGLSTSKLTVLVLTGLPPEPVTVTVKVLSPDVRAFTEIVLVLLAPLMDAPEGAFQV